MWQGIKKNKADKIMLANDRNIFAWDAIDNYNFTNESQWNGNRSNFQKTKDDVNNIGDRIELNAYTQL